MSLMNRRNRNQAADGVSVTTGQISLRSGVSQSLLLGSNGAVKAIDKVSMKSGATGVSSSRFGNRQSHRRLA